MLSIVYLYRVHTRSHSTKFKIRRYHMATGPPMHDVHDGTADKRTFYCCHIIHARGVKMTRLAVI